MEKQKSDAYLKAKDHGNSLVHPTIVDKYDGQSIYIDQVARFDLGNYLGGGIAGVVYEAYDRKLSRNVAIKILNPIGFRLAPHTNLKRFIIVVRGIPLENSKQKMSIENVSWLAHPTSRQIVAAYEDPHTHEFQDIPLNSCVDIWGWEANVFNSKQNVFQHQNSWNIHGDPKKSYEDPINDDPYGIILQQEASMEREVKVGSLSIKVPYAPSKYLSFLKKRQSFYREIAHMHKLTANMSGNGHKNVLKLYDVLELVQCSKTTIFLVLELASGGELFDRIRADYGVDENVARNFLKQLLAGVSYCHNMGVCHRDLKPENLLLTDSDEGPILKIADFGLSAHFIASVSHNDAVQNQSISQLKQRGGAAQSDPAELRRLNSVVGSPHYVAPEVLQSGGYGYDGRKADMWSLGVITYGMLAGCLPFGKDVHHCARYAKFVEWIRSVPTDRYGRMKTHPQFYQPSCYGRQDSKLDGSGSLHNQGLLGNVGDLHISDPHETLIEFPSWFFPKNSSPTVCSLLAAMLHPDPAKRVSCEEAKKHEWLCSSVNLDI